MEVRKTFLGNSPVFLALLLLDGWMEWGMACETIKDKLINGRGLGRVKKSPPQFEGQSLNNPLAINRPTTAEIVEIMPTAMVSELLLADSLKKLILRMERTMKETVIATKREVQEINEVARKIEVQREPLRKFEQQIEILSLRLDAVRAEIRLVSALAKKLRTYIVSKSPELEEVFIALDNKKDANL